MPKLKHERCNTCWTCSDCGARWCYDFCEDYAHACYNDDLDTLYKELPEGEHSPAPPRQTRGKVRYQQYLRSDSGLTFGEWPKAGHYRGPS